MEFIDEIKNETIIICKSYFKKKFLFSKKLLPVKLMGIEEFKKKYYFDFDENTIMYVMDKYNVKYDVALVYINNLYYVDDILYNESKLDFLVDLKRELNDKKLLIYNEVFKKYVKDIDIIRKICYYGSRWVYESFKNN